MLGHAQELCDCTKLRSALRYALSMSVACKVQETCSSFKSFPETSCLLGEKCSARALRLANGKSNTMRETMLGVS